MGRAVAINIEVVVPWIDAEVIGERRLPSAEWLVARGTHIAGPTADWRAWLAERWLAAAGGLASHPAGPCLRAHSLPSVDAATWACLRPVHLLAAIDHLQVDAAPIELEASERDLLLETLGRHFAGTGYAFHAVDGPDWLLASDRPLDCSAPAPDSLPGRNLRELMPRGPDAAAMAALMNEVQMLLHEHPVNQARAARGVAPVNGLWPWGFGRDAPGGPLELPVFATDDGWLAAAWRAHGGSVQSVWEFRALLRAGVSRLCLASSTPVAGGIEALERDVFEPLRDLVGRGQAALRLRLGGREWSVGRAARWRVWGRARPLGEALR